MAGNNSIQFVRGTSSQRASHTETSLVGQPIYETDTNKLYVGDGKTGVNDLTAVKASAAEQDANGNVIDTTYAKLSQVIRTDSLQALNRNQYENFILNSTPKVFASLQTSEPTWKTVGKLNNYGLVRMTVATTINGSDYTEAEFIISVSYMERASITQIGNSEGSFISAIRLRGDSGANMFIDLQVSNPNPSTPSIAVWFDVRRNDSSGYFETVDFETFNGNDGDYAITTLALNKNGISTTGGVYQNGSPVLVGDQSAIFESNGTTAKNATNVTTNINGKAISSIFESDGKTVKEAKNADSYTCRQYTLTSGWMMLTTSEKTLTLLGQSSDFNFDRLEIYYTDTTDAADPYDGVHRLLVSMLKPSTLTYSFSVPIVIDSKVSTVTISNDRLGVNKITFKLAEESEKTIFITQVLGIRTEYKAYNE